MWPGFNHPLASWNLSLTSHNFLFPGPPRITGRFRIWLSKFLEPCLINFPVVFSFVEFIQLPFISSVSSIHCKLPKVKNQIVFIIGKFHLVQPVNTSKYVVSASWDSTLWDRKTAKLRTREEGGEMITPASKWRKIFGRVCVGGERSGRRGQGSITVGGAGLWSLEDYTRVTAAWETIGNNTKCVCLYTKNRHTKYKQAQY